MWTPEPQGLELVEPENGWEGRPNHSFLRQTGGRAQAEEKECKANKEKLTDLFLI